MDYLKLQEPADHSDLPRVLVIDSCGGTPVAPSIFVLLSKLTEMQRLRVLHRVEMN